MRLLTPQEKAVFEAIVNQRLRGDVVGDIFRYDLKEGQQFLHDNNASVMLNIDHGQQWNIINQLAKDGFISIDLMNIYEVKNSGNGPSQVIKWVYGTDWARKYIQMSMSIDDCFKKYSSSVFIKLSLNDINRINMEAKPTFRTKLLLDEDPLKVGVLCEDGNIYTLKAFNRESGKPHDAFIYAYYAEKEVDNVELSEHVADVEEDEYVAKIYERNETINTILSAHIKLYRDRMQVQIIAEQTPAQLAAIKERAIRVTRYKKSITNHLFAIDFF